jgi:hypothetical protein
VSARAEAIARLGGRYDARVLEPSPPAIDEPPWFADDPVGRDEPRGELQRVSPSGGGDLRWDDLTRSDPELRAWCAERWLGAYRPLAPAPASLAPTRRSLHRVAEGVIAPARERANGKLGLRYTRAGFGTPFFADDVQLRVAGDELIVCTRAGERAARITTLSRLAAHVGPELLPDGVDDDDPLEVDPAASRFLGDWYGFGASLLEELRAQVGDELEPSRVQLWPEHFDIAVEIGIEGARAAYGASPGDSDHDDPYLYVVPWGGIAGVDELFTATCFMGAELGYQRLLALGDGYAQREAALRFFNERRAALAGRSAPSAG